MANPSSWFKYESERIEAELEVARKLIALNPAQAGAWAPLIEKAEAAVKSSLACERVEDLRRAAREAEAILAPIAPAAKALTVHLIGHAHIDMNWLWSWPETVALTSDTLTTAANLMDDYPAFKLSQSQASIYRIMEEHDPALLARVKGLVQAGRWEVTASHWVECDKNMTGGESLCRHLLYARRYLHDLLGVSPDDLDVDWSPDTFGHAATVPTYLARGGVKYLYLHRPGFLGAKRPNAFWWKGPDGSKVLTYNDSNRGYNGVITPALGKFAFEFLAATGARDMLFVYGVGDHGGGPTRRDIERGIDMGGWPIYPKVIFSTARAAFQAVEAQSAKLPVFDGELNTEFSGCYTSESTIKRSNRVAESRLFDTEAAASFAWRAGGRAYPNDALTKAWRDTLFAHFHDILPGSGVPDTRTRAHGMYQETIATTTMAETLSLRALSSLADSSGGTTSPQPATQDPPGSGIHGRGFGPGWYVHDGRLSTTDMVNDGLVRPYVIWNHTDRDRDDIVEATLWFNPAPKDLVFTVRGPDGKNVAAQIVRTGNEWWYYEFVVVAFPVHVPAFGYAVYTVTGGPSAPDAGAGAKLIEPRHPTAYCTVERPAIGVENELVRAVLDPETGCLATLHDKRTGHDLVGGSLAGLLHAIERPHGMTAWTVGHTGPWERLKVLSIGGKEEGPYRASVNVELALGESRFTLTYRLFKNDPTVYLDLEGTWLERGTPEKGVPVLKLQVPLNLTGSAASYEIPLGFIDRPWHDNEELPALQWASVSGKTADGKTAGLVLANDSKHGYALDGNTFNLTLIRSSYDPDPLPEIGKHEIKLALTPYSGKPEPVEATRIGRRLNHPLRAIATGVHAGKLGKQGSLVAVEGDGVVVSGIKKAEDGDALIVRAYSTEAKDTDAVLRLHATLGTVQEVAEVDLLERKLPSSTAKLENSAVRVLVPARGLVSVRIQLA
ncbi:MAG: glycoside hydrolase family 38 C-terminal domain-containing protein [Candidatus Coatesbacteria bacterium]